jgi:hypothetical protein
LRFIAQGSLRRVTHKKPPATDLVTVVKKTAPSVQKAMGALGVMGRELAQAKTYKQIRMIERRAEALHVLYAEVDV